MAGSFTIIPSSASPKHHRTLTARLRLPSTARANLLLVDELLERKDGTMNRFEKFLLDSYSIESAATDRCYSKNRSLMGRCAESLAGICLKKIFVVSAIALLFVSACAVAQAEGAPTPQATDIRCTIFGACGELT